MINIQTYSEDVHQQYLFTKKQSLDDLRIYCGKDVLIKLLAAQSDINSGKLLKRKFCLDAYSMYIWLNGGSNITATTSCPSASLTTAKSTKEDTSMYYDRMQGG